MNLIPISLDLNGQDSKSEHSDSNGGSLTLENEFSTFHHLNRETKICKIWVVGAIFGGPAQYRKTLALIRALSEDYKLHVYIHSPGGCIITTCHLLSAINDCKAETITHNLGLAASCGSLLLSVGNKIRVEPNSTTMFHNAGMGLMDLVHRAATKINHTQLFVEKLFDLMKSKGLITDIEHEAIVKRGEEFYITSTEIEKRLREKGIWFEGGVS